MLLKEKTKCPQESCQILLWQSTASTDLTWKLTARNKSRTETRTLATIYSYMLALSLIHSLYSLLEHLNSPVVWLLACCHNLMQNYLVSFTKDWNFSQPSQLFSVYLVSGCDFPTREEKKLMHQRFWTPLYSCIVFSFICCRWCRLSQNDYWSSADLYGHSYHFPKCAITPHSKKW